MKTVGLLKSTMREETRVALLPQDFEGIRHPGQLMFQEGYARHLGIEDDAYREAGARVVPVAEMRQADVLCVPKPDVALRKRIPPGATLWGWAYIDLKPWLARAVVEDALSVIDFHNMRLGSEHVFWANARLAGLIGMMQAMVLGRPPERLGATAVLGRGNVGSGAMEILDGLGVAYTVFWRDNVRQFFDAIARFDTVVNCVRWDDSATFLVARDHQASMRKGAFLVDLSGEGCEGSRPRSIYRPVYRRDHLLRYYNEHIPALLPAHASGLISRAVARYVDRVVEGTPDPVLEGATLVRCGQPTDVADEWTRAALDAVGGRASDDQSARYRSFVSLSGRRTAAGVTPALSAVMTPAASQ
jgi:alanine dehydrogenase